MKNTLFLTDFYFVVSGVVWSVPFSFSFSFCLGFLFQRRQLQLQAKVAAWDTNNTNRHTVKETKRETQKRKDESTQTRTKGSHLYDSDVRTVLGCGVLDARVGW